MNASFVCIPFPAWNVCGILSAGTAIPEWALTWGSCLQKVRVSESVPDTSHIIKQSDLHSLCVFFLLGLLARLAGFLLLTWGQGVVTVFSLVLETKADWASLGSSVSPCSVSDDLVGYAREYTKRKRSAKCLISPWQGKHISSNKQFNQISFWGIPPLCQLGKCCLW